MTPMPYEEVNPRSRVVLLLEDGRRIEGLFTSLRINRKTLPEGKYAYDIRDSDDGSDFCHLKPFVWVNHAGTIVTDAPVAANDDDWPLEITEWTFVN